MNDPQKRLCQGCCCESGKLSGCKEHSYACQKRYDGAFASYAAKVEKATLSTQSVPCVHDHGKTKGLNLTPVAQAMEEDLEEQAAVAASTTSNSFPSVTILSATDGSQGVLRQDAASAYTDATMITPVKSTPTTPGGVHDTPEDQHDRIQRERVIPNYYDKDDSKPESYTPGSQVVHPADVQNDDARHPEAMLSVIRTYLSQEHQEAVRSWVLRDAAVMSLSAEQVMRTPPSNIAAKRAKKPANCYPIQIVDKWEPFDH